MPQLILASTSPYRKEFLKRLGIPFDSKNPQVDESENEVRVIERECSEGREFFIELVNGEYILGFVRLRLPLGDSTIKYSAMPEHAFIRELHVYSQVNSTHDSTFDKTESHQHRGYGSILMKKAEEICLENSYYRVAVIAGVGVRGYYEKNRDRISIGGFNLCYPPASATRWR